MDEHEDQPQSLIIKGEELVGVLKAGRRASSKVNVSNIFASSLYT